MFHFDLKKIKTIALLSVLQLVYLLNFVHRQLPAVVSPQLQDAFGLSKAGAGLLYGTTFSLLYATAGLILSFWTSHISYRVLISGSIVLWSTFSTLHAFAGSATELFVFRGLLAVSQSVVTPLIYGLLAASIPSEKRGFAISWYASGIFLGIAASFFGAGSWVIENRWQDTFLVSGLVGVVLGGLSFFVLPKSHEVSLPNKPPIGLLKEMLKRRNVQFFLMGFSMLSVTGYAMLGFASTFIRESAGGASVVPFFGWFVLGCAISVPLAGWFTDRISRKNESARFYIPIGTAFLGALSYSAGFLSSSSTVAFFAFGCGMMITSSYNGLAPAILQNHVKPDERVVGGALYLLAINVIGLGIGPFFAGFLAETTGNLSLALLVTMLIGNLSGASFLIFASRNWTK